MKKSKPSRFKPIFVSLAALAMIVVGFGGPSLAYADDPVSSQPTASAPASPSTQPDKKASSDQSGSTSNSAKDDSAAQPQDSQAKSNDQQAAQKEQPADQTTQAPKPASIPKPAKDKATSTGDSADNSSSQSAKKPDAASSEKSTDKAGSSKAEQQSVVPKVQDKPAQSDASKSSKADAKDTTPPWVGSYSLTYDKPSECMAAGKTASVKVYINTTAGFVQEGTLTASYNGQDHSQYVAPEQTSTAEYLVNLPSGTSTVTYSYSDGQKTYSTSVTATLDSCTPPPPVGNGDTKQITFCHATPPATAKNGWNELTTSVNAFYKAGHDGHAADIVPPFSYTNDQGKTVDFAGLNWDEAGQAVFNNGCKSVQPPPPAQVKVHGNVTFTEGSVACVNQQVVYTAPTYTVAGDEHVVYDQSRGTHQADFGQSVTVKATGVDDSSKYELAGQTTWSHTFGSKPSARENCTSTPPPPSCATSPADVAQSNTAVSATGANPGDWLALYDAADHAHQVLLTKVQVDKDCTASVTVPAAECKAHDYQWDLASTEPPAAISDTTGDGIADVPGYEQGTVFTVPGDQSKCATPPPPLTKVTASVIFNDECGTANDWYSAQAVVGVDYSRNGSPLKAGIPYQPGRPEITILAKAQPGYELVGPHFWGYKFTNKPCQTPPSPPVTPKPPHKGHHKPPHTTPVTHTEVTTVSQLECKAGKMKSTTTTTVFVRKNGERVVISTKVKTHTRDLTKAEKAKCATHKTPSGHRHHKKAGHKGSSSNQVITVTCPTGMLPNGQGGCTTPTKVNTGQSGMPFGEAGLGVAFLAAAFGAVRLIRRRRMG